MRGNTILGMVVAAMFAAGVLAVALFNSRDDWLLRAAQENAVRCLTRSPCPRLADDGTAAVVAPPLTAASSCAVPGAWQALGGTRNLLRCRDGVAYLYHMGRLARRGAEQWIACAAPDCRRERAFFD